jgi:hypothetical protein
MESGADIEKRDAINALAQIRTGRCYKDIFSESDLAVMMVFEE